MGAGLVSFAAAAEAPNGAVTLWSNGGQVRLEARGVTRRQVLARFFAEHAVRVDWRDAAFAEETVEGSFAGTPADVARRLLANADFFIVYKGDGESADEPRISQVVVLGRAASVPVGMAATGRVVVLPSQPVRQAQAAAPVAGEPDYRYQPRPPRRNRQR